MQTRKQKYSLTEMLKKNVLESASWFDDWSLEREAETTTSAGRINVIKLLSGNGRNIQWLSNGLSALGNGLNLLGRHGDELALCHSNNKKKYI